MEKKMVVDAKGDHILSFEKRNGTKTKWEKIHCLGNY